MHASVVNVRRASWPYVGQAEFPHGIEVSTGASACASAPRSDATSRPPPSMQLGSVPHDEESPLSPLELLELHATMKTNAREEKESGRDMIFMVCPSHRKSSSRVRRAHGMSRDRSLSGKRG